MRLLGFLAVVACEGLLSCPLAFADDVADGLKFYNKGKFVEASAYFNRAVDSNNYDATAHYHLGNCFAREKNYLKAKTEYERAQEFTDDPKMEQYCRDALERLKPFTEPKPMAPVKAHVESSVTTAGAETKAQKVREIMERCRAEAKEIMARGEERCKPILDEKRETLRTMGYMVKRRVETTTEEERADASREYDTRIESIKREAKQHADLVLEQGRRDASSVGQGLPNLDELLGK